MAEDESKTGPLRKLEELIGTGIIVSSDKEVMIHGLNTMNPRKHDISGYVASESKVGFFHTVTIAYEPRGRLILYGDCTCGSCTYRGWPCKHMLRLRNVYQSNSDKQ